MTLPDVGLILMHHHPDTPFVELRDVKCFNPEQIAQSGQCFRADIDHTKHITYWVAYGKELMVSQYQDGAIRFHCSEQDFNDVWCGYFDLWTSYQWYQQSIKENCTDVEYQIARKWDGLRILRQEPFETTISFMLSTANNIPRIMSLVEALCKRYGSPIERTDTKAFPTWEQLQWVTEQDLRDLGMGFRAKYIYQAIQDQAVMEWLNGYDNLHTPRRSFDHDARRRLMKLNGVGEKVAKCIMLYGLGNMGAYPVDTWMKKVHERLYGGVEPLWLWERSIDLDGLLQMYLFYNERMMKDEGKKAL